MKKKQPPEQYKPKPVKAAVLPLKGYSKGSAQDVVKAVAVQTMARNLLRWLEKNELPPSTVLLHGLVLARNPEEDGLPLDTLRPHLKTQGEDGKKIREILEVLSLPHGSKIQVLSRWLETIWVAKKPGVQSFSKKSSPARAMPAGRKRSATKTGQKSSPQHKREQSSTPPVVTVKKQRKIGCI